MIWSFNWDWTAITAFNQRGDLSVGARLIRCLSLAKDRRAEFGPNIVDRCDAGLQSQDHCLVVGIGRGERFQRVQPHGIECQLERVVGEEPSGFLGVVVAHVGTTNM